MRAPETLRTLGRAFGSWRTAAVTLQSFPSALPLGLVLSAIPAWLATEGVDITTIGFIGLTQAPWTFKFLWSPLLDRYAPPFLGRKRGWAVLAQMALLAATLALALTASRPDRVWLIALVSFCIAFFSATQDIAIDAYAVEMLREDEQGVAAGARAAVARFALYIGRSLVSVAEAVAWPVLFAAQGLVYLPAALLMAASPEPAHLPQPPQTLREAVWGPLVGFLRQPRAIEIAVFLILYKFGDNLASGLISAFLVQKGYELLDVGAASATVGLIATLVGSLLGGALTTLLGLGHALWAFGLLQAFSNVGFVLVAQTDPHRPLLYAAMAVEAGTSAMGTAAFSVLLLRLTAKRFSATQYALFSSVFALGRTLAPPIAGVAAAALGWPTFFLLTIAAAAPGLLLLHRFAPLGVRDPHLTPAS